RVGSAERPPLCARVLCIHWNASAGRSVALGIDQVDWGLVARHKASIGIGRWSTKPTQCPGMLQQPPNVVAPNLTQASILRLAVEEIGVPLPQALMDVHARSVVFEQRFRH